MKRIFADNARTARPVRVDRLVLVAVPRRLLIVGELGGGARDSGGGGDCVMPPDAPTCGLRGSRAWLGRDRAVTGLHWGEKGQVLRGERWWEKAR